jgi:hypothetical protein
VYGEKESKLISKHPASQSSFTLPSTLLRTDRPAPAPFEAHSSVDSVSRLLLD